MKTKVNNVGAGAFPAGLVVWDSDHGCRTVCFIPNDLCLGKSHVRWDIEPALLSESAMEKVNKWICDYSAPGKDSGFVIRHFFYSATQLEMQIFYNGKFIVSLADEAELVDGVYKSIHDNEKEHKKIEEYVRSTYASLIA